MVEALKQTTSEVQYPTSRDNLIQKAVKKPTKKVAKNPEEQYKAVLTFSKIGKALHLKKTNYEVSVSIALNSSRVSLVVCVLDADRCPSLIWAYVFGPWLAD